MRIPIQIDSSGTCDLEISFNHVSHMLKFDLPDQVKNLGYFQLPAKMLKEIAEMGAGK